MKFIFFKTIHTLSVISLFVFMTSCDFENYLGDLGNDTEDQDSFGKTIELLSDAEKIYYDIYLTSGESAAAEATIDYLNNNSEIEKAGISEDSTVFIFFKNGILGIILEESYRGQTLPKNWSNKNPLNKSGGESFIRSVGVLPFLTELPGTQLGPIKGNLQSAYVTIDNALRTLEEGAATVNAIKNTISQGPGILFWAGHGAYVPLNVAGTQWSCALMTGESYPSNEAAERIKNGYGDVLAGPNRHLVIIAHDGRHYMGILPEFIKAHGDFDKFEDMPVNHNKSLAYISCCYGYLGMSDAFTQAGIDSYFGWTHEVNDNFAKNFDRFMFEQMTDTCTAGEAYGLAGSRFGFIDPSSAGKCKMEMKGDTDLMIESYLKLEIDGSFMEAVTKTVAIDEEVVVGGYLGSLDASNAISYTLSWPAISREGTWNCVTDEDASIIITDMSTLKPFVVDHEYVGCSGTIKINRFEGNLISIEFSGTLGYWSENKSPYNDPPDQTRVISNGIFKYSGIIFD